MTTATTPTASTPRDRRRRILPRAGSQNRVRTMVGGAIGVAVIVAIWALVARRHPELVLPSPAQTWSALMELVAEGAVVTELTRTLLRALGGVAIAVAVGIVWGTLNARSSWMAAISGPALAALLALPPVIVVAVGLVWFGPGDGVVRLVIAIVALPLIVVAVQEAIRALDRDLLEMAAAFDMGRLRVLRHIVAPGITSPVAAVVSVAVGQALRVAVMAELLAASTGIGAEIALARTNLATADLFAWALVMVAAVIVIDYAVLRPIVRCLTRWREVPAGRPT